MRLIVGLCYAGDNRTGMGDYGGGLWLTRAARLWIATLTNRATGHSIKAPAFKEFTPAADKPSGFTLRSKIAATLSPEGAALLHRLIEVCE
jgi:hypothetical protein